jgi:hypothetical protein
MTSGNKGPTNHWKFGEVKVQKLRDCRKDLSKVFICDCTGGDNSQQDIQDPQASAQVS